MLTQCVRKTQRDKDHMIWYAGKMQEAARKIIRHGVQARTFLNFDGDIQDYRLVLQITFQDGRQVQFTVDVPDTVDLSDMHTALHFKYPRVIPELPEELKATILMLCGK